MRWVWPLLFALGCGSSSGPSDAGSSPGKDGSTASDGSTDSGESDLPDSGEAVDVGVDMPMNDGCDTECVAGFEAQMVRISTGTFTMGAKKTDFGFNGIEFPPRAVTITRPFRIGSTEVTQGQWNFFFGRNPSHWVDCGDDCPVEQVSWVSGTKFANALSKAAGRELCYTGDPNNPSFVGLDCNGYRLPTEAEWEYAARAGSNTSLYTGDISKVDCSELDSVAEPLGWYCANSGEPNQPHPVRQKLPNAFGLYDTAGNVWEWVNDTFAPYKPGAATDPTGPTTGDLRVRRGGSYRDTTPGIRVNNRSRDLFTGRHYCIGFRIARSDLD